MAGDPTGDTCADETRGDATRDALREDVRWMAATAEAAAASMGRWCASGMDGSSIVEEEVSSAAASASSCCMGRENGEEEEPACFILGDWGTLRGARGMETARVVERGEARTV